MRRPLLVLLLISVTTVATRAQQWPSFRGTNATGIASSGSPPVTWAIPTATTAAATNVVWSTLIPGLAHSSPVVWGDRVFLTSAVAEGTASAANTRTAKIDPSTDLVQHQWKLYSLDRRSGRIQWERTVVAGVPRVRRYEKASHASATPVTNGTVVIAPMGSEGFYCYDMSGTLLWKQDLGVLDVGMGEVCMATPAIAQDMLLVRTRSRLYALATR